MAKILNLDLRDNPLQNFIINGNMDFAQRGTSFAAIANGAYSLDRWVYHKVGAMVHTVSQDTDVPTFAESGVVSTRSLRLNLTTPDTSIAAGDLMYFAQKIEGFNFARIAQKPMVLSFWVKATIPGIYCVSLANSALDLNYIKEYTITSANTWEKIVIPLKATPSAGTWNYSNGVGLWLRFILAAGTSFQAAQDVWQSGNLYATSNQVNGVNTGATNFRIAQVMLNVGTETAPFSLAGESYADELALCQRYCSFLTNGNLGNRAGCVPTANTIVFGLRVPVPMRATPTLINNVEATNWQVRTVGNTAQSGFSLSLSAYTASLNACDLEITATKSGHGLTDATFISTSNFGFDAEL
jgi:hypothetical protein